MGVPLGPVSFLLIKNKNKKKEKKEKLKN